MTSALRRSKRPSAKPDGAVGVQHVAAGHGDAGLAFELIGERRPDAHRRRRRPELEIAVGADRDAAGAGELEPHLLPDRRPGRAGRRIRPRGRCRSRRRRCRDRRRGSGRGRAPRARAASRRDRRRPGSSPSSPRLPGSLHGDRRRRPRTASRSDRRPRGRRARTRRRVDLGPRRADVDRVTGRARDEDARAVVGGRQRLEAERDGRPRDGRGRELRIRRASGGRRGRRSRRFRCSGQPSRRQRGQCAQGDERGGVSRHGSRLCRYRTSSTKPS